MNPGPAYVSAMLDLRMNLAGCVSIITSHDGDEACPESLALVKQIEQQDRAIRGNRTRDTEVTWTDLHRMMSGTLKIVLEHLEKHP